MQLDPPRSLPSHSSPPFFTPSPQEQQPVVSSSHVPVQASVPPSKPSLAHVAVPRSAPSQASVPSRTPSPQVGPGSSLHDEVSKLPQSAAQRRVPLAKPSSAQVRPPSSVPSQVSPPSITPSPHRGSVQSVRQASGAVSELFSPSSHSSSPSTTPLPHSGMEPSGIAPSGIAASTGPASGSTAPSRPASSSAGGGPSQPATTTTRIHAPSHQARLDIVSSLRRAEPSRLPGKRPAGEASRAGRAEPGRR